MVERTDYRYSIRIWTRDLDVLHALRGLSQFAQGEGSRATPWGNTKEHHWRSADQTATFRFTRPRYRDVFLKACEHTLRPDLWHEVEGTRSDNDPAQLTDRERGRV